MQRSTILPRVRAAAWLLVGLAATACRNDDATNQQQDDMPVSAGEFRTGVEVSSLQVPAGDNVLVSVVQEGRTPQPVLAMQGYLKFNPARLEYVGQAPDEQTMVRVNSDQGAAGSLRFLSLRIPSLERTTASFVFRVKQPGYASNLHFQLEVASLKDAREITAARSLPVTAVARAVPDGRELSFDEVIAPLARVGMARDAGAPAALRDIAMVIGTATRYGDVNGNNVINATDVGYIAGVAVGSTTLNDPTANRDLIAANVAPANLPGLGEPGDACRPGATCAGGSETNPGVINATDVSQVSQEALGSNVDVVGETIPGRGAATPGLVVIPQAPGDGIYDASDCGTTISCNWTASNTYRLDGIVQFGGGAVLNIAAGTRIEGNSAVNPSALYIRRDAQIFAVGTAAQPIVFSCTAAVKTKGCWGGLAIAGNAPVNMQQSGAPAAPTNSRNPAGGGNTRILEGTTAGTAPSMDFGGSNAADNSGTLRYVRIEYAGFIVGVNNELNGLTLGGVGSGTTLEYLQMHAGLDDGIEFFGGTANVRYLVLTANSDDSFDWSFGWQGSAQFVIVQQDSLDADKGLEGDNSEGDGATFNEIPRTNGPLYNFTLVGTLFPGSTAGNPNNNVNDAVHIRRGNWSSLANSIIIGFPVAFDWDDPQSCTGPDAPIRFTTLIANLAGGNTDGSDPACFGGSEGAVLGANDNTTVASAAGQLVRPFDVTAPDVRPVSGSTAAIGTVTSPPAGNTFIQVTTYRGAVPPATAITQNNLSWYMGWTRGWSTATQP